MLDTINFISRPKQRTLRYDSQGKLIAEQYITMPEADITAGYSHESNFVCSADDYFIYEFAPSRDSKNHLDEFEGFIYEGPEYLTMFAGGGKGLLGDIDGDGRMELVIVQADDGIDDRYVPHQITCVTAYRLSGEMMWQRGVPKESCGKFGSDFPAQIYDIDQDGTLEILCVMDKQFVILNSADGTIKQKYSLPGEYAHDCIIIANLRGLPFPRDIILKDR